MIFAQRADCTLWHPPLESQLSALLCWERTAGRLSAHPNMTLSWGTQNIMDFRGYSGGAAAFIHVMAKRTCRASIPYLYTKRGLSGLRSLTVCWSPSLWATQPPPLEETGSQGGGRCQQSEGWRGVCSYWTFHSSVSGAAHHLPAWLKSLEFKEVTVTFMLK